jgi:hypothetical protein
MGLDVSDDDRALALVRRLYAGSLPQLQNRMPQSPGERGLMWAAIGRKLARKEREFSRGSGAKPGSKHKTVSEHIEPESKTKRTYRANLARKARTIFIAGEELVLEDGVDVDMVRSALAGLLVDK